MGIGLVDVLIGPVFAVFYDLVKEAMGGQLLHYKPLEDLKNTLDSVELPTIERITVLNSELGLPNVEVENLKSQMEKGVELVTKLSKLQTWNCMIKCRHARKLVELDGSLKSLLEKLKMQDSRVKREVQLAVTRNADKVDELDVFLTSTLLQKLAVVQLEPNAVQEIINLVKRQAEVLGGLRGHVRSMVEKLEVLEEAGTLKEIMQMTREKAQQLLELEGSVRRHLDALPLQQVEIEVMGNNTETEPHRVEETRVVQGAALGAAFSVLFDALTDVNNKITVFKPIPILNQNKKKNTILKPILKDLKSTLDPLKPLIKEIEEHKKVLDRPNEELENFEKQMKNGAKLIQKCSKVRLWNRYKKYKYINQLLDLNGSLNRMLVILSVHGKRDGKETLVLLRNLEMMGKQTEGNAMVLQQRAGDVMESSGSTTEPVLEKILVNGVEQGTFENHSSNGVSNMSSSEGSQFLKAASSRMDKSQTGGKFLETSNSRVFSFAELKAATKNFRRDTELGELGNVFKGLVDIKTLAPSNVGTGSMTVAIQKLNTEFWVNEELPLVVNFLGKLSHPNLVKLLGYCWEETNILLVYEFMPKAGSLENHIFRRSSGSEPLSWDSRLKIAMGAAQGLAFLHTSEKQVIHRNFKTSNILLDENYNAKISGFDLAKLGPICGEKFVSTSVVGTYGYADPEYIATGHLTVKSDVYSFGVVLLEILTGLRSIDKNHPKERQHLVHWASKLLSHKRKLRTIIDPQMEGQYSLKAALRTAQIILKCIRSDSKSRPSMEEVVEALKHVQAII